MEARTTEESAASSRSLREDLLGIAFAATCAIAAELLLHGAFFRGEYLAVCGRILALGTAFFLVHRIARYALSGYQPKAADLFWLATTIIGSFVIILTGKIITEGLNAHQALHAAAPGLRSTDLLYAIPFAAGGLLLQVVLGTHVGLVFCAILSLAGGTYFSHEPLLTIDIFAVNVVAVLGLTRFRSRSAYLRAGMKIGVYTIPFVIGSLMIEPNATALEYVLRPLFALLGGVLSAFIASGMAPLVEHFGGYVTDLRLIEMATLDHPLLKDLSLRASGTWNHSMVMGMMAESAASAVGANSVVARVGAYFHDVGKMNKPLYFVENQLGEENRHDKLSPSMSALIIRSHVKDGVELAREHKLPEVIEAMIHQHHGTSTIEYFYEKALKDAQETNADVDKNLYSYPGPKPQTKEAGILMLADGIEAAARTLSEPTLDRIQGLVQKMINKVFSSGQLDECELTLHDLHLIAKCFTRVLHSIHHQRIAYAEPAEKINEKPDADSKDKTKDKAASAVADAAPTEAKKEDLKRLGL